MSLSKRDQMLLLILLGIAIFLALYLGVGNNYKNKRLDVDTQITTLTPRLSQLKAYSDNLSNYRAGIKKSEDSISAGMQKFPGDVRSEDIAEYVSQLSASVGFDVKDIKIAQPEFISLFKIPEENSDSDSSELMPVAAMRAEFTLVCGLSYDQLKTLLNSVYASPSLMTVKSVDVSFDSNSGKLNGKIVLDKYFLASKDYRYSRTDYPPVSTGTGDPFGTFPVKQSKSPASDSSSASPSKSAAAVGTTN